MNILGKFLRKFQFAIILYYLCIWELLLALYYSFWLLHLNNTVQMRRH